MKKKKKNKVTDKEHFLLHKAVLFIHGVEVARFLTFSHTYSCMHTRTFPGILPSLLCYSRSSLAINVACIKIRTVNTTLTCDLSECILTLHFLARIM